MDGGVGEGRAEEREWSEVGKAGVAVALQERKRDADSEHTAPAAFSCCCPSRRSRCACALFLAARSGCGVLHAGGRVTHRGSIARPSPAHAPAVERAARAAAGGRQRRDDQSESDRSALAAWTRRGTCSPLHAGWGSVEICPPRSHGDRSRTHEHESQHVAQRARTEITGAVNRLAQCNTASQSR